MRQCGGLWDEKTFAFGVLVPNTEIIAAYEQGRLPNPKLSAAETDVPGLSFVYHKDSSTISAPVGNSGVTASIPSCPEDQAALLFRTFPSATEISRQQLKFSPPSD